MPQIDLAAIFLGVSGEGDDRRARFAQPDHGKESVFTWEAYRYNGRSPGYWAYGSSADRVHLLEGVT